MDLFTGIGGITIALQDYVRPVAYCERELYCISVLLERMREDKIPIAPICTDVKELRGSYLGEIDIIYGGFPCQDISVAGRGKGLAGERSALYWEIFRLAKETSAPLLFLENVPAIRTRGLKEVVGSLTELGYDCRWTNVTASAIGAPHKRQRWFLLAYSEREGLEGAGWKEQRFTKPAGLIRKLWSEVEPTVCGGANGLPHRLDRIKALGNAVVPDQARVAFEKLLFGME